MNPVITEIVPTVYLRRAAGGLEQCARVTVRCEGEDGTPAALIAAGATHPLGALPAGDSTHDVFIPAIQAPREIAFELRQGDRVLDSRSVPWRPPRPWVVHVVQMSHHDVGYTDLPSHVLPEHDRWLDEVIDFAAATRDYPDEAQFRMIVEQAWSLAHFLRHATPVRARAMIGLIRSGHVEVTALFGNLTTELCGHETLVRALYPSARIARRTGVPVVSAEHNDVPGFTWGLAEILAGAGVRLLCPGLPNYYTWGGHTVPSFWDEEAVFGYKGMPGAFWWESPSGKRILFWCNNAGCGGDSRPKMPHLAERLQQLSDGEYPYSVLRWPVQGGRRDNSPYIGGYCETIREWNARWAFPRLISSTNAQFYGDLVKAIPPTLPVRRGDVPGQDYPVGAASTARATAVNRNNHSAIPAAEALASMAGALAGSPSHRERLDAAYEEALWHDEHTWGHHFPCGPTSDAHAMEKAVHALRGATLAHDVVSKAMARVADAVRVADPGLHLVVFNSLPRERTDLVQTPLREIDNCGSEMAATRPEDDPAGGGHLWPALLGRRSHVTPPVDIVEGKFDLIDAATGERVPYQIRRIRSPLDATPYAADRFAVEEYQPFERRFGLARTLEFVAHGVPALGYRTYRLAPRVDAPAATPGVAATEGALENEFYRVEVDPGTGAVTRIYDKRTRRELVDRSPDHPFGSFIVRDPEEKETLARIAGPLSVHAGPLRTSLHIPLSAPGHPEIEEIVTLTAGLPRIEFAVHVVKDPTPLLDAFVAFPFDIPAGRFTIEEPLHAADPAADRLPGAYSNRLTAQNWVRVSNGQTTVAWSSLDAPVVAVGRLWPSRVSQAHACIPSARRTDPPQSAEDLRGGTVYSLLFANNFGTNFQASQSGAALFRYAFAPAAGDAGAAAAADFGEAAVSPLTTMFTQRPGEGTLPPVLEGLRIDPPAVRLLALKEAEQGKGLILRLWNASNARVSTRVDWPLRNLRAVQRTNLVEMDLAEAIQCRRDGFEIAMEGGEVRTLLLLRRTPRSEPRS